MPAISTATTTLTARKTSKKFQFGQCSKCNKTRTLRVGQCRTCYNKQFLKKQPCKQCGDPEGPRKKCGAIWRFSGYCLTCYLETKRCKKCGTLNGDKSPMGVPRRYEGLCLTCWNDLVEYRGGKFQRAERPESIPARDDREMRRVAEVQRRLGIEAASILEHGRAIEEEIKKKIQERPVKSFDTAEMMKEYRAAMKRIKTGWCCELGTQRLCTAKQLVKEGKLGSGFKPVKEKESNHE